MSLLTQALFLGVAGGVIGTILMNILTWELMEEEETTNEVYLEYIGKMIELQKQHTEVIEGIKYDFKNN